MSLFAIIFAGLSFCVSVLTLYFNFFHRRRRLTVSIHSREVNANWLALSLGFANSGTESLLIEKIYLSLRAPDGPHWPDDSEIRQPDEVKPDLPAVIAPKSVLAIEIRSKPFAKGVWSNRLYDGSTAKSLKFAAYLNVHVLTSRGLAVKKQIHVCDLTAVGNDIMGYMPQTRMFEFFAKQIGIIVR